MLSSDTLLSSCALYRCQRKRDLAKLVGISRSRLRWLAKQSNFYAVNQTRNSLYTRLWKPKDSDEKWLRKAPSPENSDNYRAIDNPIDDLKSVQRRVHDILSVLAVPTWLFAPAIGKSYVDNAAVHVGSKFFHLLDLATYFPSCKAHRIFNFFHDDLKCERDIAGILTHLTTLAGSLPQGSPCSPILAYYSNSDVWASVAKICTDEGITLSVYADDVTMSSLTPIRGEIIWKIKSVMHSQGLETKASKEASLAYKAADITGVIVGLKGIKPPNRQTRKLQQLEGAICKQPEDAFLMRKIRGRRAQIKQISSASLGLNPKD